MNWKNFILLICFALSTVVLEAQTKKAFISAADDAYYDQDYYSAMDFYKNALDFGGDQTDIRYRYAQSARNLSAYSLADSLFQDVYDKDAENYPLASFYKAEMAQRQGKYEEALENYKLYLSIHEGESEFHTSKAKKEIEACDWAQSKVDESNPNSSIERLSDDVNSEFSEFGPYVVGDSLYFSSLRFQDENSGFNPDRLSSKILLKNGDLEAAALRSKINYGDKLTAHTAFTENMDYLFYTVCEYQTASDIRCDLYYARVDENLEIIEPGTKLPEHINLPEATQTQPMVYQDELYFVSDRTGGEGKLDIWKTMFNLSSMNFSAPTNLSSINTSYDDITPFISKDGDFYFSSEGYIGLGGFDVYSADPSNLEDANVENLGSPVNSSYNDIYYYEGPNELVYLASNRSGSTYLESSSEACCYDLYNVDKGDIYDIKLNAQTFDAETMEALIGATVRLIDADTGEELDSVVNYDGHDHLFDLEPNKNYLIIADKEGYYPDSISLSTKGINSDTLLIKKLYLGRDGYDPNKIKLDLSVFDGLTNETLNGATVCIEDLDNGGDPIIITNFDSNDFSVFLNRDTRYRITVKKDGYESSSFIIDTGEYSGETQITKKVYLIPNIGNLNDYLPLTLYFDNDQPNKRSWKRTTDKTYTQTYYPYANKREEFKQKYGSEGTGEQRIMNQNEVDDFFTNELEYGFTQLQKLLPILLGRLDGGERVTLVINGYASPKYTAKYNARLSERRISSVKNELNEFSAGALTDHINSGRLEIIESPYGESNSGFNVSDSQTDRRNSVYSPEASRERKTEILRIQTSKGF